MFENILSINKKQLNTITNRNLRNLHNEKGEENKMQGVGKSKQEWLKILALYRVRKGSLGEFTTINEDLLLQQDIPLKKGKENYLNPTILSAKPIKISKNGKKPRPVKPVEPGRDECCGCGCVGCVYDVYDEKMIKYESELAAWENENATEALQTEEKN